METHHQELQWAEAQQIKVNVNLITASQQQLRFLATVDKNRCLYQGPTLLHAVSRYNFCWLPLLAKQVELGVFPLVAPLDCEWVWHCHRLNPLRYKADCEELYGRVLDNSNVVSSVEGASTKQTEEIWKVLYPNEPYLMDLNSSFDGDDVNVDKFSDSKSTNYDLISAVKRQSTFFYQVSRPHMSNEEYLEGSIARYKAFLHLIRKNMKSNLTNSFCVPTYDIDLIWHSHQLHPAAYCQDTMAVFGKVLDHDDTDSDRGEGAKLNVGFNETIKRWEETFGLSYGRAGARYRGPEPSPLMVDSIMSRNGSKKMNKSCQDIVKLPKEFLVEVLMEIVGVKISPQNPGEKLFLYLSKKDDNKQKLKIPFDSEVKEVVAFQCEPNGKLIFELVSSSNTSNGTKTLGTACLSLPKDRLSEDLFLELFPPSEITSNEPMTLRVSLSMTPPFSAPCVLFIAPLKEAKEGSRILMPQKKLELMDGSWMCVVDKAGKFVTGIKIKGNGKKEVIGVSDLGEIRFLAESDGFGWRLMDSEWSLHPSKKLSSHGKLYELTGERKVIFIPGRKLEYETQSFRTRRNEDGYMTVVEISSENPNGKAIALFDFNSCALEIKEEWFLLPGIISACVLSTTQEDLDKGNDLLTRKMRENDENLVVDGNEFMANCSGTGCGSGGGACAGCRGGCQPGGCSTKCSGNCSN